MGQSGSDFRIRRDQRYPTAIPVVIIADRAEHAAEIKDISRLGCCIAGTFALAKGDEIVVVIGGMPIVATVAWSKGELAGANFHKEIDPLRMMRNGIGHPMFTQRRLANMMLMSHQEAHAA